MKKLSTIPEQTDGLSPTQGSERSWSIHTGAAGYDRFQFELMKSNLLDLLDWTIEKGKIKEQKETLIKMINSEDRENFVVADEIIKTKMEWNLNSPQKTTSMKQ